MATKTMDLGQVMGTSAYQEAQAGGYTGTQAEFQEELAGIGKAGKPFIIEGTLGNANGDNPYQITDVSKSRAEVKAAVQAGELVMFRLNAIMDLPLTEWSFEDNTDGYAFSAIAGRVHLVSLYYTGTQYIAKLTIASIPPLSDNAPSAPGTASAGTSDNAARADHVHPKEVSDDDRVAWNGKASKPTVTTVTLTAAGWNATTKKQTVTVPGVLADTSKQVIWVTQTTETAIDAYLEAGIVPVAQAANAVTLRADTVPTADITVNIVVQEVQ